MSTRVVEVDFGRLHPSGLIRKTGVEHELTKTSRRVTNFLVRLRTPSKKLWLASKVNQRTSTRSFPRPEMDALYKSDYSHRHRVQSCDVVRILGIDSMKRVTWQKSLPVRNLNAVRQTTHLMSKELSHVSFLILRKRSESARYILELWLPAVAWSKVHGIETLSANLHQVWSPSKWKELVSGKCFPPSLSKAYAITRILM